MGHTLTVSGTQRSTGLITANGGITVASGQTLTVSGTQTSTGLITANGGLTLGNNQGITCGATSYAPSSTQIGYYLSPTAVSVGMAAGTQTTLQTTSALGIGIYWICFSGYFNAFANNNCYFVPTFVNTNITSTIVPYQIGGNSGANVGYSYTGVIKVNVASSTVVFQGQWNGSSATLTNGNYSLIRIA